jgi:serine/threonine protein kinase
MFNSNKLSDQFVITQNKLGNGAFGSVYMAKLNDKEIAVKCEAKSGENLTLIREFKICRKIYTIKKYLKYKQYLEDPNVSNKEKVISQIENMEKNPIIKIYNYLTVNNLLTMPNELPMDYLIKIRCVPETFSYIECNDFNFLTMELCGDNFENIIDKYTFSDGAKYFIAHRLLHTMSCIHRSGIIHRDIKLSNLVFNKKLEGLENDNIKKLYPIIIDLGLAKEYYKYEGDRVLMIQPHATKNITGTLRYISLNIHEYKSPSIIDDLISLSYSLVVIFTDKNLPWIGHKKDTEKFDSLKHTHENCKCGYHKNKLNNDTKTKNTIAEVKFHTSLEDLVGSKYKFLIKWLKYLYSLKLKQLPSYNQLYKMLYDELKNIDNLYIEIIPKNNNVDDF